MTDDRNRESKSKVQAQNTLGKNKGSAARKMLAKRTRIYGIAMQTCSKGRFVPT